MEAHTLLKEILTNDFFHIGLEANDKEGIIKEIAKFFEKAHLLNYQSTFDALWAREQKGSTGLGKGLAVPHARVPKVGSMKLVVFYSKEGKDFKAYDNVPTNLFFAAIIDEDANPQEQLEMLRVIVETYESTDLIAALKEVTTTSSLKEIVVRRITETQNG